MSADEAVSLCRSAAAAGRSASEYRIKPRLVRTTVHEVRFPFAIPYALLRWIEWAGRSHAHNALAIYELCKGVARAAPQYPERGSCEAQTRTLIVERATAFLIREENAVRRLMPPICARAVLSWLKSSGLVGLGPSEQTRTRCREELIRCVRDRWPRSLLAARLHTNHPRKLV
jgi:hypothetical protein